MHPVKVDALVKPSVNLSFWILTSLQVLLIVLQRCRKQGRLNSLFWPVPLFTIITALSKMYLAIPTGCENRFNYKMKACANRVEICTHRHIPGLSFWTHSGLSFPVKSMDLDRLTQGHPCGMNCEKLI